ncbi:hypothetical protein PAPYR_2203 [Paratrimastix pyriformis]|uniref:Uncharacterized protein n=1 Tax=Paratrimastix pyriformis TaxID=342808 RepID=A0ABQ8UTF0_9EUKA|nr:hypothetical protein PAPYR_2203 [Paratrimastix pyriformis]
MAAKPTTVRQSGLGRSAWATFASRRDLDIVLSTSTSRVAWSKAAVAQTASPEGHPRAATAPALHHSNGGPATASGPPCHWARHSHLLALWPPRASPGRPGLPPGPRASRWLHPSPALPPQTFLVPPGSLISCGGGQCFRLPVY